MKCYFGIDVGGTNIKFGKFREDKLVKEFYIKTLANKKDPVNPIIKNICDNIDNNLEGDELCGIGIGVPGPCMDGVVLGAENIYWNNIKLKEILNEKYPNVKISVLNDANAATLGEWFYGSGNKTPNMVFLTLGTGIGGGIIFNGQLYIGATGSAGEVGHLKIFPFNGRDCKCGCEGCLEQYASATGIVKTARGMMRNGPTVLTEKEHVTAKDIFDAAEADDKTAVEIVDKTAYYLSIGLVNIANTLNPNKIVIGGGISRSGDILLNAVKRHFKANAFVTIRNTEIALATLYNSAGIYGCYYAVTHEY